MYVCSLSCKTINNRENFWNVNCFATDKMQEKKLTKLDLHFQDSLTELILGGFNCFFKTG